MREKIIKNNDIRLLLAILSVTAACSLTSAGPASADVNDDVMATYAQLEKSGNADGQAWFNLAQTARSAGNLAIAGIALERALSAGWSPVQVGMERTRLHVAGDDPGAAVAELQALLDQGFTSVGAVTGDSLIHLLAGRADYDALVAAMTSQAFPCEYDSGFQEFDFWVGEWDVHVANGTLAGSNSIKRAERSCVLLENWVGATGGTGMSINYLDKASNEWVQIWHAAGGSQINIRGGLTDAGMLMVGQIHYVGNGTTAPFRALWTLLPDGRVRQFFEQSNDGGATWVPWFEGFYSRKTQ